MRIEKCWFCSSNIYPGHGRIFVRNDSTVFRFCGSKCRKHFKRRVNPAKLKWTKIARFLAGKELVDDKCLKFEHRVVEPKVYDREMVQKTVSAIPLILKIRRNRERQYIKDRILTGQEKTKEADLQFIQKRIGLLEPEVCDVEETSVTKKKEKKQQTN